MVASEGPAVRTRTPRRVRAAVPRWLAVFFATLGALCALAALVVPLRPVLLPVLRLVSTLLVPASPNLAYAAFLLLLAAAVAARKRVTWWITVGYLALLVAADGLAFAFLSFGTALASLLVTGALLVLVAWARPEFHARVRKGAFWRAVGTLVVGLVAGVLVGWGLVALFPGSLEGSRFLYAASRVLGGTVSHDHFDGDPPTFLRFLLGLFGALALLYAATVLFRSQRARIALHPDDETRVRLLLSRYGGQDSLGYFATRRDKNVVFAPNGRACVTYRVELGVCLASADPVGDREAWPQAIDAWLAVARRYAWSPAAMGASEEGARAYAAAGLHALQLGDEAILHLDQFDLEQRELRMVRQATGRLRRAGATVRIRRHSALSAHEMAEVLRCADDWRDTEEERGFSMALGRLGDPADGDCVLVEALDESGERIALLSFVPWGRDGISLDLMRRSPQAPNGVMEFLVAEIAAHGRAQGIQRVSLNFAVFRSVFEEGARIGAGPLLRLWRRTLVFLSRWWQLEALYRSNLKYRPQWYPRLLCYAEPRLLARIGLASGVAEGFVNLPGHGSAKGVQPPVSAVGLPPLAELEAELAPARAVDGEDVELARMSDQVRVRHRKLSRFTEAGNEPYPVGGARTHTNRYVVERAGGLPPGARTGERATVAGRVLRVRDHGGVLFATLRDWSGDLQLLLSRHESGREESGRDALASFAAQVDLGDQVEALGEVGTSNTGEPSLVVRSWRMTGKCLHPLPDKRRGLTDPEARVRQRYVDLIVSPGSRDVVRSRGAAVQALRQGLLDRDYLEVETPMLQQIHGGANARPFTTHINAYDLDLYLRIAPELYLKRLCVGGLERVFEIGRTFRNEGASYKHNPEFTMLEAYQAFADYDVMLHTARELIQAAATAANGAPVVHRARPDGAGRQTYDISGDWPVRTVFEAISDAVGEELGPDTPLAELRRHCDRTDVPYAPEAGHGDVVLKMYERLVEERTELPTFYKDFPTEVSPLTRQHRRDPRLAERWDLVAFGTELGTAYSELTDPVEQRRRLTRQSLLAADGDPEAMELDEDFLTALEYAMPPTGGLGIGVDRLVMFLLGRSIRETLPFPLVRAR